MWRFRDFDFLFNFFINSFQYIQCGGSAARGIWKRVAIMCISIHPMWRFRAYRCGATKDANIFQYIQCGGSARSGRVQTETWVNDFNTSNVEVPRPGTNFTKGGDIYFNTSNVEVPLKTSRLGVISLAQFQYIQCGGSALPANPLCAYLANFNTSNVEVPPCLDQSREFSLFYFNTSNVEVPLLRRYCLKTVV